MELIIENNELVKYIESEDDKILNIPEGVTVIKEEAFDHNVMYVREITYPSTLEKIEDYATGGAIWVEKIELPEKLTDIGAGAFFEWLNLKKIALPYGVKKISTEMFGMCEDLEEISKPDTVEEIEHSAFYHCINLKSIDLTGVKKIGVYGFWCCM